MRTSTVDALWEESCTRQRSSHLKKMTYPFCDKHEQSMDELQTHIVSHLSILPKVKKNEFTRAIVVHGYGRGLRSEETTDTGGEKVSGHHGPHRAQRLGARHDFERAGRRRHAHVRHRKRPQRDHSHEASWRFVLHEIQRKKTRRTPIGTSSHPRLSSDVAGFGSKARHRWSALEVERDVDSLFNTRETVCATVRICKLMKSFKSTDMKIAIYIRHMEEASLVKALVKAGAKLQEGRAPVGGLARDIQKWLDTQAAV